MPQIGDDDPLQSEYFQDNLKGIDSLEDEVGDLNVPAWRGVNIRLRWK